MNNIIEINKLNYSNIIKDLTLTIEENKFVCISGSNNSGKTTLLRILNRNINANFNTINICGDNINTKNIDNYSSIIQAIFPKEILFFEKTIEDEINYLLPNNNDKQFVSYLIKNLNIKKFQAKEVNSLKDKEIILYQLFISLINKPKILLLDNINLYFDKKEMKKILLFLKEYQEKYNLTILIATLDLNIALYTDYIYILNQGSIIEQGIPIEILQKDNILNKLGLNVPFMIDLSVKLRDYDLVKEIELDLDRMIDILWN